MSFYNMLGKIALVTGGGSGIGRACCEVLAREGARVVVADINLQTTQETVSLLPGSQQHMAVGVDVSDKGSVEAAFKSFQKNYGEPPSLLVNSAGIAPMSPFTDTSEEEWMKVIDVNLKGTFLMTQSFTKMLLDGGGEVQGSIVNVSSILAKSGLPSLEPYTASKGGVISLTKSCAASLIRKGIRVNCVLPGMITTPMIQPLNEVYQKKVMKIIPQGRAGHPHEVAEAIAFLLSDRSSYMVGSCIEVTGGYMM
ncbi:hypothetical protein Pmani_008704 [Petrolisthes manimaculis]|uniref:(3R)-3-hydroxyacyl-CoA dehydrogenase n=1 Tax=Petrolisthes manimaculis TaxID=1843537 RepID=A0AAE1Q540_9EUCA|nr:hypothetical protein Pmani_008704 [Petrolisthes manimaculis]